MVVITKAGEADDGCVRILYQFLRNLEPNKGNFKTSQPQSVARQYVDLAYLWERSSLSLNTCTRNIPAAMNIALANSQEVSCLAVRGYSGSVVTSDRSSQFQYFVSADLL